MHSLQSGKNLKVVTVVDILERIEADKYFLNRLVISDKAIFHISGYVHSLDRIWENKISHVFVQIWMWQAKSQCFMHA